MPLIRRPPDTAPPEPLSPRRSPADGLHSDSLEERWEAARSLARVDGAVAILAAALLTEKDQRVREAIFTSLALTDTAASVDAILPYLRSDIADARTSALDALRAMPTAMPARLAALLADPDSDVRLLACDLARELPPNEATDLLAHLLDTDAERNVCAAAIEVLAERGTPAAIPSLRRCATRFADEAFLPFAIESAINRIGMERSVL